MKKITILLILLTLSLHAIEGAVSAKVVPKERYAVSEEIVIQVDIKSTAYSMTQSKIGLENSPEYVVSAPKSAASLQTVDINGTDWSVVHYEYKLYPLHAGKLSIPPIAISFLASMGYGQESQSFELRTEGLSIDIASHEGVNADKFVLSTPYYSLKTTQNPTTDSLKEGDAFTLLMTQEAESVPDILLTPIRFESSEYFKVYTTEPTLTSSENRGVSSVSRSDKFTFVAIKEGNATLPSQELLWWDTKEQRLHKEQIPTLHFTIIPQPKVKTQQEDTQSINSQKLLSYIAIILLLITLLYRAYPLLKKRQKRQKELYNQSEAGLFETLQKSCQDADAKQLYRDFYSWLESADTELYRLGFTGIGEAYPFMADSLTKLESALSDEERGFESSEFCREVQRFREELLRSREDEESGLMDGINPSIGVGKRTPLPPNRACGSPAHGSLVD